MNEETFNLSIRKFLKTVGVRSQHEIEQAVAQALASGALRGDESLHAVMTLNVPGIALKLEVEGTVALE